MLRNLVGSVTILALAASPVYSARAVTTAGVNFRAGPSSSFETFGVVPDGTEVEVLDCDAGGSWCAVSVDGQEGFMFGRYLQEVEAEDGLHWPRAYGLEGDAFVVVYQPQISAWDGVSTVEALVAAEYRASEEATPVFGVIGFSAGTQRDGDAGTLVLHDIGITSLDFTALDRDKLAALSLELNGLLPTGPVPVAEERIVASLAAFEQGEDVLGLSTKPPAVFVSLEPAILVQTDGPAVFAPVAGLDGVSFVVNTNWDLFEIGDVLYLRNDQSWLTAPALDGDWQAAETLPEVLSDLPDDGNWKAAREALAAEAEEASEGGVPVVFVSDEPAELVQFDGQPVLEDVPGTDLEWASNTETDLFRYNATGAWYLLISGRWFRTYSREGPFEFASDDLPVDFRFIPEDAPYYSVRSSVPGTSEANEARLRATIPETARVEMGAITPDIAFDGDPVFVPIDGTGLQYAVNTSEQVIQVGASYYLVQDGVWFVSDSPNGPWTLATAVPDEIYEIPPTSPVHNVTHVRVYDTEPDAVWYGYTAGYLFGFLAWGTLVYGTGWYHPPYWRYGVRPIYFPRPLSYGIAAYYNPAVGAFGRYGYGYGPYRGIAARSVWNPVTGTYARGARAYGPQGSRGFVRAYNPRTGTRAAAAGASGVYGRWGAAGVQRGADYVRARGIDGPGAGRAVSWDSSRGSGFAVSGRRGNVYAGRDGNVYRRAGDDWQRFGDGNWRGVEPPRAADLRRDGGLGTRAPVRDSGPVRSGTPVRSSAPVRSSPPARSAPPARAAPPARVPSHVQYDLRSREIGNQRSFDRRSSAGTYRASPSRPRPSAGRARGGGGGRRR